MKYERQRAELSHRIAERVVLSEPKIIDRDDDFIRRSRTFMLEWHLPTMPHKRGGLWLPISERVLEDVPDLTSKLSEYITARARSTIANLYLNRFYLGGPEGKLPN